MVDEAVQQLAEGVEGAEREGFIRVMKQMIRIDSIKRAMLDLMVRQFTVTEIDALARFFGSPEKISITKKFWRYMGDVLPIFQQEVFRAASEIRG